MFGNKQSDAVAAGGDPLKASAAEPEKPREEVKDKASIAEPLKNEAKKLVEVADGEAVASN